MKTLDEVYGACRDYVIDFAEGKTDSSLVKKLKGFLRARDVSKLSSCSDLWDPNIMGSAELSLCLQVEAFFKKNATLSDDAACKSRAEDSFRQGEIRCKITNKRLDHFFAHLDRLDPDMSKYMARMEQFCSRTLGSFTPFLESLPKLVRITNGATATRSRRDALPYLKANKRLRCTSGAAPYLQALSQYYGYGPLRLRLLEWNRVEFVPKNWKTHRTIACEQEGNIPLQLAFDTYVKKRFKRKTLVDLSDQSRNRAAAYCASVMGDYSTIDLRAASDSLAYNTVAWLIPHDWFIYLDRIRSKQYRYNGQTVTYEKFSSMGNGTTFGLESLIFAAACYAVGSRDYNVYGDDIVIETKFTKELMRVLRFIGFAVNEEKSFTAGPFRESCGGNYYYGEDITPHYVRANPKLNPELCHLVNGLAKRCVPYGLLANRLKRLVQSCSLPIVPFNEDSMAGVCVDISTAHDLKLLNYKRPRALWIPSFKAYVSRSKGRRIEDSRTLFLWYLSASVRKTAVIKSPIETSLVPTLDHKYRRKWVTWSYPGTDTPDYLYWWSGFLTTAA